MPDDNAHAFRLVADHTSERSVFLMLQCTAGMSAREQRAAAHRAAAMIEQSCEHVDWHIGVGTSGVEITFPGGRTSEYYLAQRTELSDMLLERDGEPVDGWTFLLVGDD